MTSASSPPMAKKLRPQKSFARRIRDLHLYLGTFFAPAILFFSLTGAAQTFSWHESQPGDSYQAPAWIRILGQVHKKQTPHFPPPRREPPPKASTLQRPPTPKPAEQEVQSTSVLLVKWFVFLMALGLTASTLLGLYMAFKFSPGRGLTTGLLVAGTVLPLALILAV